MAMKCNPCDCLEQYYRDNTTFKKGVLYLLCQIIGSIVDYLLPIKEAEFATLVPVAPGSIGAGYALATTLPVDTREVRLDNQTNGDVMISMTGGATDTYHLPGGQQITLSLAALNLVSAAVIHLKNGTAEPTTGTFYISSYK